MTKLRRFLTKRNIILAVIVTGLAGGGYVIAKRQLSPTLVETSTVTRGTVRETVTVSGFVKPSSKAALSFGPTTSKIVLLGSKVNDQVVAGQSLLGVDVT